MWINGFNDNLPGYPKVKCERVRCPDSYMHNDANMEGQGLEWMSNESFTTEKFKRYGNITDDDGTEDAKEWGILHDNVNHPVGPFGSGKYDDARIVFIIYYSGVRKFVNP